MPTPVEIMWEAIKQKEFSSVKSHIEQNTDANLLNALRSDGRNLPIYLINITVNRKEPESRELLNYVLTHPTMDWGFQNKRRTAAKALLSAAYADGDMSVIESLHNVSGFILSNGQLTYELAVKNLKDDEKLMGLQIRNGKPQKEIDDSLVSIEKWKKIVALVRDITILHAIKTDNADLIERMEQAGGEPLEDLGEFGGNKRPAFYIGKDQLNPEIKAWRTAWLERMPSNIEEEMREIADLSNRYRMFQEEADRINATHDAIAITILDRAAEGRQERMERALSLI